MTDQPNKTYTSFTKINTVGDAYDCLLGIIHAGALAKGLELVHHTNGLFVYEPHDTGEGLAATLLLDDVFLEPCMTDHERDYVEKWCIANSVRMK